jgi:hypothetical protein
LHDALLENQECSLWPWCKCDSHVQGNVRTIGISCSYSNLESSPTCWCIDPIFGGDSWEPIGIHPRFMHLHRFRGSWYVGWCGNALILGSSFLTDTKARINVGNGMIWFRIENKNLIFRFQAS